MQRKLVGKSQKSEENLDSSSSDEATVPNGQAEVSQEEENQQKDDSEPRFRIFDKPIHRPRESLFSVASGYNNYRGFLNLCIVLLILSNARLLLENVMKYGILVDPIQWITVILADPHRWPCFTVCMASNIFVLIALKIEQKLCQGAVSERMGTGLQIANLSSVLIFPAVAVWFLHSYLLAAFTTMIIYSCLFMKLTSYVMVNRWYRLARRGKISPEHFQHPYSNPQQLREKWSNSSFGAYDEPEVAYPDNLTARNIYYFYAAPTLCYELNYPRTPGIRKVYLAKRIGEILLLTQLELALAQQWLLPIMQNSVAPLRDSDWSKIMERLLKLAIPNHCMWLIGFYLFFHSAMNAIAEVMRFADRQFYKDWWNAETVQDFWRNWNMPVHRWASRHMFVPLLDNGFKKWQAALFVFLVSAFFHEYVVSIPLGIFRLWAFMGMLMQIPFAMFVQRFMKGPLGNMAVWMSLIVGQPLAILMYFHDYYILETKSGHDVILA
ncbi:diacylglycerol O-acyltransferase 1-like [Paramacrobiotus metropolitanus]|uniref:diacylglycerol O-acyltransferase 1-like n=1 Tax=Paramacrobiotus metropolitanus TaxID=2943436 RepID=UPI0024456DFF|nr:diacylglycerol O-acyltransferase 1-like [Paramacrobiotus metropolitanus]